MSGVSRSMNLGKLLSPKNVIKIKENTIDQDGNELFEKKTYANTQSLVVQLSQNALSLPKFTNVFSRPSDDGVTMDDLDALQQDLEKLLSTSALRNRFLRSEIESIDKVEEKQDRRGKQTSLKRKRQDDKLKSRDVKNCVRIVKKNGLNVNNYILETPLRQEVPKLNLPKHDTSEKFWASVEPFCASIQKEDIAFLNNLIEDCTKEIIIKVPEIGDHYTSEWSDELIYEKQSLTGVKGMDSRKNSINVLLDTFSNPKNQSLLTNLPATLEKFKVNDLNIFKNYNRKGCMQKKMKKELVDQGVLNNEDLKKGTADDEVLDEIKRCQHELLAVNDYNKKELYKLRNSVDKDLKRQEIKDLLDKCDSKVMDVYKIILQAKQKALQNEVEDFNKQVINEKISKEFEEQSENLVEEQFVLNRQLLNLTENSLLV